MPRVLHVISGLGLGGAEAALCRLVGGMDREAFPSAVVSLTSGGARRRVLEEAGVAVHELGLSGPLAVARALRGLARVVRAYRPQVLQCWMYHADLLGGLVGRALGIPVVWGLRQSDLDPRRSRRHTRWVAGACAKLSHWVPARIVACSERVARVHRALGYAGSIVVIPNGLSLARWRRDPVGGRRLRRRLRIPDGAFVAGTAARWHPQKDHQKLLAAAARLPGTHWVLCGEGITWENDALARLAAALRGRLHLLGPLDDLRPFYSALDVHVLSSSFGEGFPNVVLEAMACEAPCVVTDVGDAALIVGETGKVVPPRDPEALAQAIERMLALGAEGRRRLGARARARVAERFTLERMVAGYQALYREVAGV